MPSPPDINVIVSPWPLVAKVDCAWLLVGTEVTTDGQGSAVGLNPEDMVAWVVSGYCACSAGDCHDR